ncbi:hypothetical protein AAFF_G00097040 [Aldrovandia affinis]|uniref:Uncharacterized protein n=1 Tax=Aldrovandia affinis TaxID=143900 RepID=A0AAD7RVS0_9TELE|nr:hypothetical protein AAFF_G00097040 [Aldrovandia affinis]
MPPEFQAPLPASGYLVKGIRAAFVPLARECGMAELLTKSDKADICRARSRVTLGPIVLGHMQFGEMELSRAALRGTQVAGYSSEPTSLSEIKESPVPIIICPIGYALLFVQHSRPTCLTGIRAVSPLTRPVPRKHSGRQQCGNCNADQMCSPWPGEPLRERERPGGESEFPDSRRCSSLSREDVLLT